MKKTIQYCTVILLTVFFQMFSHSAFSQDLNNIIKGHLNGSFENYSQYYMKDSAIQANVPFDRVGMNSFLKLDYNYGKFSAGVQLESYLPPILGYYPLPFQPQTKIVNKYFKYSDKHFSIQAGDFYEQFGNGLILRSWENRQIGINNALEGADVYVEPTEFLKLKVLYGRARKLFGYSNSITRGADAELDVNALFKKKDAPVSFTLGGSYAGKYQEYVGPSDIFPRTVNAYALRFDISQADFSLDGEFAQKSADPHLLNNFIMDKGQVLQLNGSYTKNNLGATVQYRSMYNMDFLNDRDEEFTSIAPVNYLPALTKQHDYLTSNIYVYAAQIRGETGFQADLFYNFPAGTKLGGKYGLKLAANFSNYNGLKDNDIFGAAGDQYFSDANLELKKKWSKKLEMTLGLQRIFYKASVIRSAGEDDVTANVLALGGIYKFTSKRSLRWMVEHLYTESDQGSWASALAEFSLNTNYQVFVSDLYNYGTTDLHYYNIGGSVTKKATRFSLSFGKQRAGLFCVGGVCRFVPAAYGFTASLTTSFAN